MAVVRLDHRPVTVVEPDGAGVRVRSRRPALVRAGVAVVATRAESHDVLAGDLVVARVVPCCCPPATMARPA